MTASARRAVPADIPALVGLYRDLAAEMDAIKPIWSSVDGLPEPVSDAIASLVAGDGDHVYVGEIDGVPVGFLASRDEPTLPQGAGKVVASIHLVFTLTGAREVGVGEAMIGLFLDEAEERGIRLFDAHVSPGHRQSKNFFESNGFKARSIVMHRSDE